MDTDNQWCKSKWFLINAQIYNMRLLLKLLPTETNQAKKNLFCVVVAKDLNCIREAQNKLHICVGFKDYSDPTLPLLVYLQWL